MGGPPNPQSATVPSPKTVHRRGSGSREKGPETGDPNELPPGYTVPPEAPEALTTTDEWFEDPFTVVKSSRRCSKTYKQILISGLFRKRWSAKTCRRHHPLEAVGAHSQRESRQGGDPARQTAAGNCDLADREDRPAAGSHLHGEDDRRRGPQAVQVSYHRPHRGGDSAVGTFGPGLQRSRRRRVQKARRSMCCRRCALARPGERRQPNDGAANLGRQRPGSRGSAPGNQATAS